MSVGWQRLVDATGRSKIQDTETTFDHSPGRGRKVDVGCPLRPEKSTKRVQ